MSTYLVKNNINYEKYIVIFLGLLIPFDYTSRAMFNIALVFILILFIIYSFRNKSLIIIEYKKLKFLIAVIIFYFSALIINLLNPTINYNSNIKLLLILFAFVYIINFIFKNSEFSNINYILFEKVLFYSVSFLSCILFLSFLINIDIYHSIKTFSMVEYDDWRFHSKQNLLAICIPFLINFYFRNKTNINLILFLLIIIGVFVAQGRTAIITMAIGIFIYLGYDFFIKKAYTKKNVLIVFLLLITSTTLVLYISGSTIDNIQFHTSSRFDGWIVYMDLLLKDNTFFGYGLEGANNVYKSGVLGFSHPHNSFVEVLFSLGIIGFFIFLFLVIIYIFNVFKLGMSFNKHIALSFSASLLLMQQGIGTIWGPNFVIPIIMLMFLAINVKK
ncbi:MAG: O-antigen ligase family protein [Arcobacter sp.]|uniref:O-antigen ligase family protein n=1 Tax=Arcobacter sp. TaxID=1872629 RepID=UPI003AFFD7E2